MKEQEKFLNHGVSACATCDGAFYRNVPVCVIGGGLAGLTTALECARAGRKVVLLERNRIAWGASGRNGGFVTSGYATGLENMERRISRNDAETLYRMSIEGVEIVRGNIDTLCIAGADVTPVGSNLKDIDFKSVRGGGETRIAAAAQVPPIIDQDHFTSRFEMFPMGHARIIQMGRCTTSPTWQAARRRRRT